MFELSIQREFCAAHAITIGSRREPVHGHNWRVTVVVAGRHLDDDGLLCDFHLLERRLDEIVQPLNNGDLNAKPPFDEINPTAENVARYIGRAMREQLPEGVRLKRASVTEAPGCKATWRPAKGD